MFPVVYSFCNNCKPSASTINTLKKWFPQTKVEDIDTNVRALVLKWVNTETEANQVIHEAVAHGYWGVIYKGDKVNRSELVKRL